MKDRINQILDSLTDEMNIQPIVYELFESCNPEDVKKTIENLQRALEYKNQEVKKHLSMNHEHLFSCTDLIEQLKQFVVMSKANVENIKGINKKISDEDAEGNQCSLDTTEKNIYDVNWFTFLQEVIFGLQQMMERKPVLALEGFLALIEEIKENKESHMSIKTLWLALLSQASHSLKSSLQFGKETSQDFVSVFCHLFFLPFKHSSEDQITFSKIQAVSQVSKHLEVKPSPSLLKTPDPSQILYTILADYLATHHALDIIEVLKLTQYIDRRPHYTYTGSQSTTHAILSEVYNRRTHLLTSAVYASCGTGLERVEAAEVSSG